jgi:predicted transposase/invertase (TIGR01784 family)
MGKKPKSNPDLIPATNDIVFKYVFGNEKNKDATAKLLSAILGFEIQGPDISFGDPHLKREFPKDKLGILDIFVRLKNGKTVAVEMLTGKFSNILKRIEYYISKMTVAQLGKGNTYPEIQPVAFILITTKPVLKNKAKYHSEFVMMEKSDHYVLHDLRTIHIIELSKLPPHSQGRLATWLKLMTTTKKEDLMALVKKNPELKSAGDTILDSSTIKAFDAFFSRKIGADDIVSYAVKDAERKAKRALSNANRKVEEAEKKAKNAQRRLENERRKAEKILDLIKQGYPVDQVEKMILKKR